jgi:hypothetical protein
MSNVVAFKPSISPGSIAEPGTPGGPAFVLSKTEWLAIQAYVLNALALPTTEPQFRNFLGAGAPANLSDFTRLIEAYATINGHVTTWRDDTFPSSVSLASDIYEYGANKAPIYYSAINKQADILIIDPQNIVAKEKLKAILDNLRITAEGYAKKASAVETKIKKFADDSQADYITLVGVDGNGGLRKYYNDKYGETSAESQALSKEIEAQRVILDQANAEYDHDVVVAATTPTYVWVFPLGTIAAAVVAGVYGDKAVKALERARAAQAKINSLAAEIAANTNMLNAIHATTANLEGISLKLAAALPAVQKIQGQWGAIANDLAAIIKIIDDDIAAAPPIIMSLGVDNAIRSWKNVADLADAYRKNAYVTQSNNRSETVEGYKLNTLIPGNTAVA